MVNVSTRVIRTVVCVTLVISWVEMERVVLVRYLLLLKLHAKLHLRTCKNAQIVEPLNCIFSRTNRRWWMCEVTTALPYRVREYAWKLQVYLPCGLSRRVWSMWRLAFYIVLSLGLSFRAPFVSKTMLFLSCSKPRANCNFFFWIICFVRVHA